MLLTQEVFEQSLYREHIFSITRKTFPFSTSINMYFYDAGLLKKMESNPPVCITERRGC